MTVNSKSPVTGPLVADGVNNAWAFDFKVREVSHMHLKVSDADGSNEELITSGITIAAEYLNNDSGGYAVYSGVIAAGRIVYAVRAVPYVQQMRIGNQGQFWPQTHEDALDYLAMQIQQLVEMIGRAPTMPIGTDAETLADVLSHINRLYNSANAIDEVAAHMPAIENAASAAAAAAASETSSAGSAAAAAASAASIDVSSFYTKSQIDGFRTTDQNAAKNAGNLNTGTVPNAQLPARLRELAGGIDDADLATLSGWYLARNTAANLPSSNYGFLEVKAVSSVVITQYLTLTTGVPGQKWTRRYAGTWSSWERVYETATDIKSIVTDSVKAWVRFYWNGTSVSVSASKNVSSVVRNGVGDYTVNFAAALADGNYALTGAVSQFPGDINLVPVFHSDAGSGYRPGGFATASSCRVGFENRAGGYNDPYYEASLIFVR